MPAFLDIRQIQYYLKKCDRPVPKIFIETGTYDFVPGSTIYSVHKFFDRCYTIEIVPEYSIRAEKKAMEAGVANILFIVGDSEIELPKIIDTIKIPALIWLDAHWCSDIVSPRGHGRIDPPLEFELKAIFDSPYAHIIIIDNVDAFGRDLPYDNVWKGISPEKLIASYEPSIGQWFVDNDRLVIAKEAKK